MTKNVSDIFKFPIIAYNQQMKEGNEWREIAEIKDNTISVCQDSIEMLQKSLSLKDKTIGIMEKYNNNLKADYKKLKREAMIYILMLGIACICLIIGGMI